MNKNDRFFEFEEENFTKSLKRRERMEENKKHVSKNYKEGKPSNKNRKRYNFYAFEKEEYTYV